MSSSSISELDQLNIIKNDKSANQAASTLDLDAEQNNTQADRLRNINPTTLGEKFSSSASKYLGGKDSSLNTLQRKMSNGEKEAYDDEAQRQNANLNPQLHSSYGERL